MQSFKRGDRVVEIPSTRTGSEYEILYDSEFPSIVEEDTRSGSRGSSLVSCRSHDGTIFTCYLNRLTHYIESSIFNDTDFIF